MNPPLPPFEPHVGSSTFLNHVENRYLMVDKTLFVKHFLKCPGFANLITRPRRWGKTFNFSILHAFFARPTLPDGTFDPATFEKRRALFSATRLGQEAPELCAQHLGQYPTVLLSFKEVTAPNLPEFERQVQRLFSALFSEHAYLLHSPVFETPKQKEVFAAIIDQELPLTDLSESLKGLLERLSRHFQKRCILLIDEYDTPFNAAFAQQIAQPQAGVFSESPKGDPLLVTMMNFFRTLLGSTLKGSEHAVHKIAVTGILRLAKSNLFSGVNNLREYSIFTQIEDPFATDFGFTEPEIQGLLAQNGLGHKSLKEAQTWYNGYEFQGHCLYNPWSITNWISDIGPAQPYWVQTSRNDLLRALLKQGVDQGIFQELFQGQWVSVGMKPLITLEDFQEESNRTPLQWTVLAATGYVTLRPLPQLNQFEVRLPNDEVKQALTDLLDQLLIQDHYWIPVAQRGWEKGLLEGHLSLFCEGLKKAVSDVASYHHTQKGSGQIAETFYHGLVMGLVLMLRDYFVIESEVEAGEGRLDLLLLGRPNTSVSQRAYVLEFKVAPTLVELPKKVREALTQIRERDYARRLRQRPEYTEVLEIGLAFCGKAVDFAFRKFGETDEEEIRTLAGEYYDLNREVMIQKISDAMTQAVREQDLTKGSVLLELLKQLQQRQ